MKFLGSTLKPPTVQGLNDPLGRPTSGSLCDSDISSSGFRQSDVWNLSRSTSSSCFQNDTGVYRERDTPVRTTEREEFPVLKKTQIRGKNTKVNWR